MLAGGWVCCPRDQRREQHALPGAAPRPTARATGYGIGAQAPVRGARGGRRRRWWRPARPASKRLLGAGKASEREASKADQRGRRAAPRGGTPRHWSPNCGEGGGAGRADHGYDLRHHQGARAPGVQHTTSSHASRHLATCHLTTCDLTTTSPHTSSPHATRRHTSPHVASPHATSPHAHARTGAPRAHGRNPLLMAGAGRHLAQ